MLIVVVDYIAKSELHAQGHHNLLAYILLLLFLMSVKLWLVQLGVLGRKGRELADTALGSWHLMAPSTTLHLRLGTEGLNRRLGLFQQMCVLLSVGHHLDNSSLTLVLSVLQLFQRRKDGRLVRDDLPQLRLHILDSLGSTRLSLLLLLNGDMKLLLQVDVQLLSRAQFLLDLVQSTRVMTDFGLGVQDLGPHLGHLSDKTVEFLAEHLQFSTAAVQFALKSIFLVSQIHDLVL